MKAWVGTSGYQYPEWKGTFYPEIMPLAKMLPFYAEHFSTTEINYTFRRIPSAKTIAHWVETVPEHFRFSLKAPQRITHWKKLVDCRETLDYFQKIVSGLGEKLGPILFQLPRTFQADVPRLVAFLDEIPSGLRSAFEFRHPSWFDDAVFSALKAKNCALCLAQSAHLETPLVATADFGYLRLRKEDYTEADLKKWAEELGKLGKNWSETFAYLKHEESGVGPRFAKILLSHLPAASLAVSSIH